MRAIILAPLSLLTLLPLATLLAGEPDSFCPAPSVVQGRQCVLRQIGHHAQLPGPPAHAGEPGTLDDPRTATNEFQPSQPELALFVHRSYDVKIQNCLISDFDFGIVVAQSTAADAPRSFRQTTTKILDNTIDVRTNAIDVINRGNRPLHLPRQCRRGRRVGNPDQRSRDQRIDRAQRRGRVRQCAVPRVSTVLHARDPAE